MLIINGIAVAQVGRYCTLQDGEQRGRDPVRDGSRCRDVCFQASRLLVLVIWRWRDLDPFWRMPGLDECAASLQWKHR